MDTKHPTDDQLHRMQVEQLRQQLAHNCARLAMVANQVQILAMDSTQPRDIINAQCGTLHQLMMLTTGAVQAFASFEVNQTGGNHARTN